jgi:hypothetical protein
LTETADGLKGVQALAVRLLINVRYHQAPVASTMVGFFNSQISSISWLDCHVVIVLNRLNLM